MLGSCHCRAAGTHTHTAAHTRRPSAPLPARPRRLSSPRARQHSQTTCRPGGAGRTARGTRARCEGRGEGRYFPCKAPGSPARRASLLAHLARQAAGLAARRPRARGMQRQQRDPPGPGGPGHLHWHFLCNALQVSPSEPARTEAPDPGCQAEMEGPAESAACGQRGHPGRERRRRDAVTPTVLPLPLGRAGRVAVWAQAPRKCPLLFLTPPPPSRPRVPGG